jgi:ABC-type multidrug transport system fused ATPase/permease subunit
MRDGNVSIVRIQDFLYTTYQSKVFSADLITNETLYCNGIGGIKHQNVSTFDNLNTTDTLITKQSSINKNAHVPHLTLTKMSAAWNNDQRCVLLQISLTADSNHLLMVTGPVGSGKSSLLLAILEEIPKIRGAIEIQGRIAYVSQIPWIFSGTIRDNILFGQHLDEARYNRILEICDLHKDINCFPNGDLSIIGQRGVGLSGGQRARVSLARVVYSDADIFLLDDPLSAVDARVGQHIFDKCICGELSGRTRILVTHQVQHIDRADKIVVLDEGSITRQGTYVELNNDIFHKLQGQQIQSINEYTVHNKEAVNSTRSVTTEDLADQDLKEDEEDRATGTVSWHLYWEFFRVGLPAVLIGFLVLLYGVAQGKKKTHISCKIWHHKLIFVSSIVLLLAPNWWISRISHMSSQQQRSFFTIAIFGGLTGGAFLLSLAREFAIYFAILRSTRKLHDKMTLAVIKSPVLFFDINPAGRIMNRFSKDIGAMDDLLPWNFCYAASFCMNVIGVLLLTAVVNLWIVFAVIPIAMLFFYIIRYYLKTARELKRMEAIRCSPVYAHVTETIKGLEVIRTSDREKDFLKEMFR